MFTRLLFIGARFRSNLCLVLTLISLAGLCSGDPAAAHPMDEWLGELRWTSGKGMEASLRVPSDQRSKLSALPIEFRLGGQLLAPVWSDGGRDSDGRVRVNVRAQSEAPSGPLTVSLPAGLLDENQSLVGFLTFDESAPVTVLIPAGQARTYPPLAAATTGSEEGLSRLSKFFCLGVQHIVEGTDHLLFLLCLLITGGSLRHLAIVVTAFTLGHSLTLALSVLGWVSLSSRLTESLIAFSIVLAALWNLRWRPFDEAATITRGRALMAAGFGLIHGLGFASMLMAIGLSSKNIVTPLLGFNLGVEVGQVAIVLMTYPFLLAVHRSRHCRKIVVALSLLAALTGSYWMWERLS